VDAERRRNAIPRLAVAQRIHCGDSNGFATDVDIQFLGLPRARIRRQMLDQAARACFAAPWGTEDAREGNNAKSPTIDRSGLPSEASRTASARI
jgi:hypothetical protein